MLKISIISPSVRPELLGIVEKCLAWQTFDRDEYEWIVVSPQDWAFGIWVADPPKREGDFYGLNKAWNAGLKEAEGELFVSIVDGLWFPPDTLERLWQHYQRDSMSMVSFAGHHYDKIENGKPEHLVWHDPKITTLASFYEIAPIDFELCIASLPIKGVKEVGGFDEEFDKFPAWSEKELACRMAKIGYKCYLDQSIQFRAIHHPRLNEEWDKKFLESSAYFQKCYEEIQRGVRKTLDNL